jgi:hypothetical protein
MLESLALAVVVAALVTGAAFATNAYHREKFRRFQILRDLTGTTVILGIARGGQGRWIAYVQAQIIDVPDDWHHPDQITVDIQSSDVEQDIPPAPWRIDWWNTYGVPIHDIVTVETATGELHVF